MVTRDTLGPWAAAQWLYDHEEQVDRFLHEHFHHDDRQGYFDMMFKKKYLQLAQQAVFDYFLNNDSKINEVIDYLNNSSLIILVVGGRGSGKSCTVHYLCEKLYQKNRDIYYIGPPMDIDKRFNHSYDLYDTPQGSINVIDESALLANSRESKDRSNISLTEILPTLRHVDKTIFVITQNSSMTDINFIKLADVLLIKKFSFLQDITERDDLFGTKILFFKPHEKPQVFFYSEDLLTRFSHAPSEHWNEKLSKCYRFVESEHEAKAYAISLFQQNYKTDKIRNLLRVKGFTKPMTWYEDLLASSSSS